MPFIEALGQFSYRVGKVHELDKCSPLCYTRPHTYMCKFYFFVICYTVILTKVFLALGPENFCLVHVSLVPVLNVVGEQVLIL